MRIAKLPNGEYYLEKATAQFSSPFIFRPRAMKGKRGIMAKFSAIVVPQELIGKKIMFRVEIVKDKK